MSPSRTSVPVSEDERQGVLARDARCGCRRGRRGGDRGDAPPPRAPRRRAAASRPAGASTLFGSHSRGSDERRGLASFRITRPRAETTQLALPCRASSTGPLGADGHVQRVAGTSGRSVADTTSGSVSSARARARARRPEAGSGRARARARAHLGLDARASRARHRSCGPRRATSRARSGTRPRPTATRPRRGGGPAGSRRELGRARRVGGSSPRRPFRRGTPLPYSGGSSSGPEESHLVLELDAEPVVHAPTGLGHECERVGARGAAGVLDEVRVPLRDQRSADPVTLEAACLDHGAGPAALGRVLEHAAERALRRRLGRLPLREQLADLGPDLLDGPRVEPEPHLRHDLAGRERRVPVREAEPGEVDRPGPGRRRRRRASSSTALQSLP